MHIDDDKLLRYVLEVCSSDAERQDISEHLSACAECRRRLEGVRRDVGVIAGVRPRPAPLAMPRRESRSGVLYRSLRIAAVFALGIVVGYGASSVVREEPVYISPAYVPPPASPDSIYGFAVADATEVPARYYEYVLGGEN